MIDDFVAPRYGEASLIDVLPSALAALGVPGQRDPLGLTERLAGVRRIAVLLVDGFGYHQIAQMADVAPTVADIAAGRFGHLAKLTTGFPSTTPVSLIGFATGATPGEHGTVGFTVRIPGTMDKLVAIRWIDNPPPALWQPVPTVFQAAAAAGITTAVVSRSAYTGTGLTAAAWGGASYVEADDIDALAVRMIEVLSAGAGPTLTFGYHPDLDGAGHRFGVCSEEWYEQARLVERLIATLAARLPADAALLVTADHGHLITPPDMRFDLDTDPRLWEDVSMIVGEPRVRYLHVDNGALADVRDRWTEILGPAATVLSRDEAIATGWYGPVTPAHAARIGDLVVVCHDRYVVIASQTEKSEANLVGYHGSLTAAEMEIPLITVRW